MGHSLLGSFSWWVKARKDSMTWHNWHVWKTANLGHSQAFSLQVLWVEPGVLNPLMESFHSIFSDDLIRMLGGLGKEGYFRTKPSDIFVNLGRDVTSDHPNNIEKTHLQQNFIVFEKRLPLALRVGAERMIICLVSLTRSYKHLICQNSQLENEQQVNCLFQQLTNKVFIKLSLFSQKVWPFFPFQRQEVQQDSPGQGSSALALRYTSNS